MENGQSLSNVPRIQFGLRGMFWLTSTACLLLAVAVWIPRLAIAWYPMLGIAAIFAGLAVLDKKVLRPDSTAVRAWGCWGLIAVSTCVLFVMAICCHLPGGGGPIQYAAGNRLAEVVFDLRIKMMMLFIISPIACGLVGVFRWVDGFSAHPGWMITAIGLYALTWVVLSMNLWFLPTV